MAAGAYTADQLAQDHVNFATVDAIAVPEDQLLHPNADLKPTAKLEYAYKYYQEQEAKKSADGGLSARQFDFCAVHNYCTGPSQCSYPCYCNGVICA